MRFNLLPSCSGVILFVLLALTWLCCAEEARVLAQGQAISSIPRLDSLSGPLIEKARALRVQHRYEEALDAYSRAIKDYQTGEHWESYFPAISEQSDLYHFLERYETAAAGLKAAIGEYQRLFPGAQSPALGELYRMYAVSLYLLVDYDQAQVFAQKAIQLFETMQMPAEKGGAMSVLGRIFFLQQEAEKALATLEEALDLVTNAAGNHAREIGRCLQTIGAVHHNQYHVDKAIDYYRRSMTYAEQAKDSSAIAYNLRNIGANLKNKFDYQNALAHCFKALDIQKKLTGERNSKVAHTYLFIGNIYFDLEDYEEAITWYQKAFRLKMDILGPADPTAAGSLMNIGNALKYLRRYEESIVVFEEVIRLQALNRHPDYNHFKVHRNMGLTYQMKGDTLRARRKFLDALEVAPDFLESKSMVWVDIFLDIASVAEDVEEAERFSQRAFRFMFEEKADPVELTEADFERALEPSYLFRIIAAQTAYAFRRYRLSGKPGDLERAGLLSRKGVELADHIRLHLESEESKGQFIQLAHAHFARASGIAGAMYREKPELQVLNWAFEIMEKSRALLLLDALSEKKAQAVMGIPDSILERERQLNRSVAEENQRLATDKQLSREDSSRILANLFGLEQELEHLKNEVERRYPSYHRLRFPPAAPSIEEVQSYLPGPEAVLVEFLLEGRDLAILAISRDTLSYVRRSVDVAFYTQLDSLRDLISRAPEYRSEAQLLARQRHYGSLAYRLYLTLLAPLLDEMPEATHLILIPDGELGYLPFELLLNGPPGDGGYRDLPYLLRDYTIQYEYSSQLLLQPAAPESRAAKGLLCFAPRFEEAGETIAYRSGMDSLSYSRAFPGLRDGFAPLRHNRPEVESIRALMGGVALTGAEATKSSFTSEAPRYRLLHLATHAFTSDLHANFSHLVFSEDLHSGEAPFLYVYELYNMRLNAELAVLSACETGAGRLQRGEGIMSLSRAFKYAGCPNIVTSLWKAEDESTKEIMVNFYAHLKNGMGKGEALRRAKLEFLDQTDPLHAHPFFWGTFILIGDDEPVGFGGIAWWVYGVAVLVGVLGILYALKLYN
jgi:CHAT domain-containing protein